MNAPRNSLPPLHDMALFVEVARHKSYSTASQQLNMPRATLSRRVSALERELGVQLLNRSTRHVELTSSGRRYFERCAQVVDDARAAQESLRQDSNAPSGHLLLTTPVDLGLTTIGPLLPLFAKTFPGITVKMDLSPRNSDLMQEGIDLAIRLGAPKDDRLIARQIGQVSMGLFAAKTYLDQHGRPRKPRDLTQHAWLLPHGEVGPNRLRIDDGTVTLDITVHTKYLANNMGLLRLLAEQGMGIAALPSQFWKAIAAEQTLERVLPPWHAPSIPMYALTTSRLRPKSVQVFLDFLEEHLPREH